MRNRISLREKTLKKKNTKAALSFVFLTLTIMIGLVLFGIPVFAKFASFIIDLRTTPTAVEVDDQTPPPPPTLDDLPNATNEPRIEIKGRSQAGNVVILYLNNKTQEVLTNREGVFSHTYYLTLGENNIQASAKSSAGVESKKTNTLTVHYDDEPPQLEILKPEDGAEFYGSRQRQMILEGKTDEGATILINQRAVVVDNAGNFVFSSTLNDGENKFMIKAQDKAGNTSEKEINVIYNP